MGWHVPARVITFMTDIIHDRMLCILRDTVVALVRRRGRDLTVRQLGVFLICYFEAEAQTVRGLASKLNVRKSIITKVLDRLSEFSLVRRKVDPSDRRSVLVHSTMQGNGFVRDITKIMANADKLAAKRRSVPQRSSHVAGAN
jgi:DNA-binding MarR family transcriptional regulator